MKNKQKILLTSMVTIVLCLCLIAGSTYALFTSETEMNIAVTSGKVEIVADASLNTVYSAKIAADGATDLLPGEDGNAFAAYGNNYVHEDQHGNTFANGGTAVYEDGTLTISKITPGDKVDFNVGVTNNSNVAIQYRYKVKLEQDKIVLVGGEMYYLGQALVVTLNGTEITLNGEEYVSDWISIEGGDPIADVALSIELPVWVGNEYQDLGETKFYIQVEAVQANAVVD